MHYRCFNEWETDVKTRRNEKLIVLDYATMSIYFVLSSPVQEGTVQALRWCDIREKTDMQRD